jgi:hypothetical protein
MRGRFRSQKEARAAGAPRAALSESSPAAWPSQAGGCPLRRPSRAVARRFQGLPRAVAGRALRRRRAVAGWGLALPRTAAGRSRRNQFVDQIRWNRQPSRWRCSPLSRSRSRTLPDCRYDLPSASIASTIRSASSGCVAAKSTRYPPTPYWGTTVMPHAASRSRTSASNGFRSPPPEVADEVPPEPAYSR